MSWTDEEIDKLYQDSAEDLSFDYKDNYWEEMEAMLPTRNRGDLIFLFTSFTFMALISISYFIGNGSEIPNQNTTIAKNTSNGIESTKETIISTEHSEVNKVSTSSNKERKNLAINTVENSTLAENRQLETSLPEVIRLDGQKQEEINKEHKITRENKSDITGELSSRGNEQKQWYPLSNLPVNHDLTVLDTELPQLIPSKPYNQRSASM